MFAISAPTARVVLAGAPRPAKVCAHRQAGLHEGTASALLERGASAPGARPPAAPALE